MSIELWLLLGCAGYLSYVFFYVKRDHRGKITDDSTKIRVVMDQLADFRAVVINEEPTEADLQKLLYDFLKGRFIHVKREQSTGANGTKVDIDVGRGSVGIEVKLAKALFKVTALQRLTGQISDYNKDRYGGDLIVVVFGSAKEAEEDILLSRIEDRVENDGAHYFFVQYTLIK